MRELVVTTKFKKDLKKAKKQGKDLKHLSQVISKLQMDITLEPKYYDHALTSNWQGCRECHINPDWLLIYRLSNEGDLELVELVRLGSHSDLFR